jgi:hypothetical protein
MTRRAVSTRYWWILLGLAAAAAVFGLGRITAPDPVPVRSAGPGSASDAGYAAGLQAGHAQGIQEGRALQEGLALPADTRDSATAAFNAGYRAGANDAFGGYDGGWALAEPYLITLQSATNGVTYKFAARLPLQLGLNYYRCPQQHKVICQEPRP